MHTSRVWPATAAASVFARTDRAGIIESRNGSATVAPIPRSTVRRDKCFLVKNMLSS
jgi:hypothetical protein